MTFLRFPDPFRHILWVTALAAALGAAYSEMEALQRGGQVLAVYYLARGALTGAVIASILTSFDGFVLRGPLGAPLRRAPFSIHVAIRTGIYLIVILFGLKFGSYLFPSPGERGVESVDVLVSLATAFVFSFIQDVNSLLGQNVLINFITGRYYAPRVESRVFLFIDMEGSTGLAERLGPLAFHRLLNRLVLDLTPPFVAAVTVRAGLHCGPVVTGEMGSVKREIVFLGDTVNTAARIQELCRETGDRVIASADLIDRLEPLAGIAKRSLGDLRLRGKGADLALYALTKAPQRARPFGPQDGEMVPAEAPAALP